MSAVRVDDVRVSIKGTSILNGVSMSVGTGEWLSIIGPNGAGKSTLLRVIAGVLAATGRVDIDEQPIASMAPKDRAKLVSWVPQSPQIPAGMTVLDYVLLGRTPHLSPLSAPRSTDLDLAREILDDLDLTAFADRSVETLSGGERQRVVIGRALVQQAPVVLLDEPTTALDLGHQQEVLHLLDRLRDESGLTIISTMHDLTLAGQFADQLLLLSAGEVIAVGDAPSVLTEEHIEQHYRAAVNVSTVDGTVLVTPRLSPRT